MVCFTKTKALTIFMTIEYIQIIITTMASSIGALISAYIGSKLAIKKYQKEKGFDAHIKWHEKLSDTLVKLRTRSKSLRYFIKENNKEAQNLDFIKDISKLSFEFQELAEQSVMYAKKDTHMEIIKLISYMNNLTASFEKKNGSSLSEKEHPFNKSINAMNILYDLISRDFREMTGLDKIN